MRTHLFIVSVVILLFLGFSAEAQETAKSPKETQHSTIFTGFCG